MATAYVEFGKAHSPGISQGLHQAQPLLSFPLVVTTTASVTGPAPGATDSEGNFLASSYTIARILSDADIWISSGVEPNVDVGPRRVLFAGIPLELIVPAGHKVAVKALD